MILDKRTEVANLVAIPAATGVIGDVIDTQVARDLGNGQPIYWYGLAQGAPAGGTSVALDLITSDAPNMSSPVVIASIPAKTLATIQANPLLGLISLPQEGNAYKRYVGIRATVAGTFTAGTITSGLTLDTHGWKAYPEGDN